MARGAADGEAFASSPGIAKLPEQERRDEDQEEHKDISVHEMKRNGRRTPGGFPEKRQLTAPRAKGPFHAT